MRVQERQGEALSCEVVLDALEHERAAMFGLSGTEFVAGQPERAQDPIVELAARVDRVDIADECKADEGRIALPARVGTPHVHAEQRGWPEAVCSFLEC